MFLGTLAASAARAASRLPANKNVKWALGANLWNSFPRVPFTEILDVMRDTGFIGIRLTQFPAILKTYDMTASQMEKEISKRNLHVITISFGGPTHDASQHEKILKDARTAMDFLKIFGAKHLVVFSPGRNPANDFNAMCQGLNKIGEVAGEMGFKAGLHNHLDQMVESPEEIDRCMANTDPKLFHFSPDTAHVHLAKGNVPEVMRKQKNRLMFADYKVAKSTTPSEDIRLETGRVLPKDSKNAKFLASIYDFGDGEIDFPACHRVLKEINFNSWLCADLDTARKGPRASYERCAEYVVNKLEPIYV
jgi:sugar phosphate isomerase/epimerase